MAADRQDDVHMEVERLRGALERILEEAEAYSSFTAHRDAFERIAREAEGALRSPSAVLCHVEGCIDEAMFEGYRHTGSMLVLCRVCARHFDVLGGRDSSSGQLVAESEDDA